MHKTPGVFVYTHCVQPPTPSPGQHLVGAAASHSEPINLRRSNVIVQGIIAAASLFFSVRLYLCSPRASHKKNTNPSVQKPFCCCGSFGVPIFCGAKRAQSISNFFWIFLLENCRGLHIKVESGA